MTAECPSHELPDALVDAGKINDSDIDVAKIALVLAGLRHPGLSLERYESHLKKLADGTAERYAALIEAGAEDDPGTRLAALKYTIADVNGYDGDHESRDDLQNADLIRVIERRKGLPVALAILYIHAGKAQGWDICGLNFPGHFVVRLEKDGERLLFDPFNGCEVLQAPGLRKLVKNALGPQAELSASYNEVLPSRAVLIRLQNTVKLRLIEMEDYQAALDCVHAMRAFDPDEYRLLLDEGVLYARTGQRSEAIAALEAYLNRAPDGSDRRDAAMFLQQIRDEGD